MPTFKAKPYERKLCPDDFYVLHPSTKDAIRIEVDLMKTMIFRSDKLAEKWFVLDELASCKRMKSTTRYKITEYYRSGMVCGEIKLGDHAFVGDEMYNYNDSHEQYSISKSFVIRTGRIINEMMIRGEGVMDIESPQTPVLIPPPSDGEILDMAMKWHKAILNYLRDYGWQISVPGEEVGTKAKLDKRDSAKSPIADAAITVGVGISPEGSADHCKDPDFKDDPAWKEYCANKAANVKAEAEYKKAKAREEAEYRRKLAEYEKKKAQWDEEEARRRARDAQHFKKERAEWRERQKTRDQQEREKLRRDTAAIRSFYKELDKSIKLVGRFGGDEKDTEYRRIEKLSKEGVDLQKAKRLHRALRTKHYDSRQAALEAQSTYQSEREKALGISQAYVEKIRDSSVTANKVLAKIAPGEIGDDIVEIQEAVINAIDNYAKGGTKHALYGAARDKIGGETTKFSSDSLDDIVRKERFHTTGIKIPDDIAAYDASGQRVKRFKSGDKLYDKEGHSIDRGVEKKLLRYRSWTTQADKDLKQGDFNKKFGAINDAYETGASIGNFIGGILWK